MPEGLIAGYKRFREGYFVQHEDRLSALAEGQQPRIALVSCCDSRVDPSVVFDAAPGELFVIRNVANLVPPPESEGHFHGTSAALEFAVTGLQVEHIVVLGHAHCGGVNALLTRSHQFRPHSFIDDWMQIAEPARQAVLADQRLVSQAQRQTACEHAAIRLSLDNLKRFPWIEERLDQGTLTLHGWYYDLASSRLTDVVRGAEL